MTERIHPQRLQRGAIKITHIIAILMVVAVFVLVGMSLFSDSPQQAGGRFMDALARHDSQKLGQLSHVSGQSSEQMAQRWEKLVNGPAKHFRFYWRISGTSQASGDTAAVQMFVERDQGAPTAYEEKFELPMVKVEGQWKVDIRRLDRRIFPFLPR